MSKSLNKITGSIFNLSDIFLKSASLLSFAEDAEDIKREIGERVSDNYKQVFKSRAESAEKLISFYYNKLGVIDDKREKRIIELILDDLEHYKFICENFANTDKKEKLYGIGKLIDYTSSLARRISSYEEIASEAGMTPYGIGQLGEADSSEHDTVVGKIFHNTLKFIFSIKIDGTSKEAIAKFSRIGISDKDQNASKFNEKLEELDSELEENEDYFEKYSDLEKEAILEELDLIDQSDALVAVSEKLMKKMGALGGDDPEKAGKSLKDEGEEISTTIKKLQNRMKSNNIRIESSDNRISDLRKKMSSEPNAKLKIAYAGSIKKEESIKDMLLAVKREIESQFENARLLDEIISQIEEGTVKDFTQQKSLLERIIKDSGKKRDSALLKVRQQHYVDAILAVEKGSLKEPGAQKILDETGKLSPKYQAFKKLKDLYIEMKKNPQNYVGEGSFKFKELFGYILDYLDGQYKNTNIKQYWNPWLDSAFAESLAQLKTFENDVKKAHAERMQQKRAWTDSLSAQNGITNALVNYYNAKQENDQKNISKSKASFQANMQSAKEILQTKQEFLTKRVRDILTNLVTNFSDIDKASSKINEDCLLKFNSSLRYVYERSASDVANANRSFIISIAKNLLAGGEGASQQRLRQQTYERIFHLIQNHELYKNYRTEIYIEAFLASKLKQKKMENPRDPAPELEFGKEFYIPGTQELKGEIKTEFTPFVERNFPGEARETQKVTIEDLPTTKKRVYQELSELIYTKIENSTRQEIINFWQTENLSGHRQKLEKAYTIEALRSRAKDIEKELKKILKKNFILSYNELIPIQKYQIITLIEGNLFSELKESYSKYKNISGIDKSVILTRAADDLIRSSVDLKNKLNEDLSEEEAKQETKQETKQATAKEVISNNEVIRSIIQNIANTYFKEALETPEQKAEDYDFNYESFQAILEPLVIEKLGNSIENFCNSSKVEVSDFKKEIADLIADAVRELQNKFRRGLI